MKKSNTISKICFMGAVIGLLLIGNACIGKKLDDRKWARNKAVCDISSAGGGKFSLNDVYIAIPYEYTIEVTNSEGKRKKELSSGVEYYQAESIKYIVDLHTQMRTIGIYSAPVYQGNVELECNFNFELPEDKNGYVYKTNEAFVRVKMSDKSLASHPVFKINEKEYETSYNGSMAETSGITSYFNCSTGKIKLTTKLNVRGAESFVVKLSSSENYMSIKSDWKSPGFSNYDYLPTYEINDQGMNAVWNIPFDSGTGEHKIGFDYVQPVDVYKMLDRAVTYGFLFIIVPFIVLFLFEIFAAVNLHPLHYLLSGAASVIFFLLLLSFSEHILFTVAYLISAMASGILVSLYVASITKKYKLGCLMCFVFILMYGYLFMSLKSEDYALLIGSLFVFIVLAAVMFFTRNVDWSNLKKVKNESLEGGEVVEIK